MAVEDEFPPYGPVQEEKRRPARHWTPEGRLEGRPMLSQPATSRKLLNRATEKQGPERATGDRNRSSRARPDPGPTRQRIAPPAGDELRRQDDQDESNRLNVFDGYSPRPPRPREGFGLQLRPRHPDNGLMEIIDGPAWDDPRGVEPSPQPGYRDIGEKVDSPPPRKVFKARNIFFHPYTLDKALKGAPARFRGRSHLGEIQRIADYLRDNPGVKVRIKASVAGGPYTPVVSALTEEFWQQLTMMQRGQAVAELLKSMRIDSSRISVEMGDVGRGAAARKVEFILDEPAQ
jgi:hypothetical protein